jgi:hypothetical protein
MAGQSRSVGGCRGYQSAAEETCVSWFGAQKGLANMTTRAARIEAMRRAGLAHGCRQSIDRGSAVSAGSQYIVSASAVVSSQRRLRRFDWVVSRALGTCSR